MNVDILIPEMTDAFYMVWRGRKAAVVNLLSLGGVVLAPRCHTGFDFGWINIAPEFIVSPESSHLVSSDVKIL